MHLTSKFINVVATVVVDFLFDGSRIKCLLVTFAIRLFCTWYYSAQPFYLYYFTRPFPCIVAMNSLFLCSFQVYDVVYGWLLCNNMGDFLFFFFFFTTLLRWYTFMYCFFWFCYHLHTPFAVWLNEFVVDVVFVCRVAFQLNWSIDILIHIVMAMVTKCTQNNQFGWTKSAMMMMMII